MRILYEIFHHGLNVGDGEIFCFTAYEESPGCWTSGGSSKSMKLHPLGEFSVHAVHYPRTEDPFTTISINSVPWNDVVGGWQGGV